MYYNYMSPKLKNIGERKREQPYCCHPNTTAVSTQSFFLFTIIVYSQNFSRNITAYEFF